MDGSDNLHKENNNSEQIDNNKISEKNSNLNLSNSEKNKENRTTTTENEINESKVIRTTMESSKVNYDYLFKVALIGDSGCGKTTTLLRYADGLFKDNTQSTIGVDFKIVSHKIENASIKLQIWDTCGSERFKSITSSFMKSCNAYILVFDLTNIKSFNNLESWIKMINENTSANFYCIVGNKCDLKDKRQVLQQDAIKFAEKYNLRYVEASAKEDENIDKVFKHVIYLLYTELSKKRLSVKEDGKSDETVLGHAKAIGLLLNEPENPGEKYTCGC